MHEAPVLWLPIGYAVAHVLCCWHVLRLLHVWLARPRVLVGWVHCHQVCWCWAVDAVHHGALKALERHAGHDHRERAVEGCSWLHHHGRKSGNLPLLHLLEGYAHVLLLLLGHHARRQVLSPSPMTCWVHHHLGCRLPAARNIDTIQLS
jgi:hypothetical protein